MELVQIYFTNFHKITIITIRYQLQYRYLAFFIIFMFTIFPPGSRFRRENECGSMESRIHSPAKNTG